jgi:alpha-beta hydrolase superfamily lysophospholipase
LAARGLVAVRFDYDGTGDSAGSEDDPGRLAAWRASIDHAVDLARSVVPAPVALVGMRMGALLAAEAAASTPSVEALVLWDPCPSGRAFVKHQRAMQLLRFGAVAASGGDEEVPGTVDLPGWRVRADTVDELRALGPPLRSGGSVGRVLVLGTPGAAVPDGLVGAFDSAVVTHGEARGQESLLEIEAIDQVLPVDSATEVADWLARWGADAARRGTGRGPGGRCAGTVAGRDTAAVTTTAGTVVERLLELGPLGLFGVSCSPAAAPGEGDAAGADPAGADPAGADPAGADPGPPWVLFLNSGNDSHAGPSRLWVELARRWAVHGVRSVRFDLSGLGDSPTRPGQCAGVVRAPEAFDDVEQVASALRPDDPSQVVLVGLCSGGYQALDSAVGWSAGAPVAVYAVNPLLRFAPPEMARGPMDGRRRVCRPPHPLSRSSRRLPTGPVRRGAWWLAWCIANPKFLPRRRGWMARLVGKGVDVMCICGEYEASAFDDELGRLRRLGATPGAPRMVTLPGLDHAVVPNGQRRHVADLLTEHVLARFGRGGELTATGPGPEVRACAGA